MALSMRHRLASRPADPFLPSFGACPRLGHDLAPNVQDVPALADQAVVLRCVPCLTWPGRAVTKPKECHADAELFCMVTECALAGTMKQTQQQEVRGPRGGVCVCVEAIGVGGAATVVRGLACGVGFGHDVGRLWRAPPPLPVDALGCDGEQARAQGPRRENPEGEQVQPDWGCCTGLPLISYRLTGDCDVHATVVQDWSLELARRLTQLHISRWPGRQTRPSCDPESTPTPRVTDCRGC